MHIQMENRWVEMGCLSRLEIRSSMAVRKWTAPRAHVSSRYCFSVPRPHLKTEEGSGHQAYPDVSPYAGMLAYR